MNYIRSALVVIILYAAFVYSNSLADPRCKEVNLGSFQAEDGMRIENLYVKACKSRGKWNVVSF